MGTATMRRRPDDAGGAPPTRARAHRPGKPPSGPALQPHRPRRPRTSPAGPTGPARTVVWHGTPAPTMAA
ncbi:hypothetical protein GCM10023100_09120 [Actinocorallia cavernae]|uniref:Uncharacterized protein n=2 Tax=Actinomycetes TaxID=1760 RepID=A0ABP8SD08_9ACTN